MLLRRHEMQPLAARRIGAPRGPGHQKIDAHAEAGLEHGESAAALPSLGQRIAAQKYVASLFETADGAVINVVVERRKRRAVVAKSEHGGDQRIGHAQSKNMESLRHSSGRTLPPAARSSPDGEKDAPNVGKNQRQAPSILGFSPRSEVAGAQICDFLAISAPEPRNSSKPLS